jgi:hypothetical protein
LDEARRSLKGLHVDSHTVDSDLEDTVSGGTLAAVLDQRNEDVEDQADNVTSGEAIRQVRGRDGERGLSISSGA